MKQDKKEQDVLGLIKLAIANYGQNMRTSAEECIAKSDRMLRAYIDHGNRYEIEAALYWAMKSLRYSIGVFHPTYAKAQLIGLDWQF